ncbi:MAG: hypothetical protein K2I42_02200 [Anaeroplasmataceae bacterium]|nr:hypothetical protein [Anaeroplasmataceae bacterium]
MKKIIAFFVLSISVLLMCTKALDSKASTDDCCNEVKTAAETETIPVYSSTDLRNPLYMGCPKCGNKYFFNMAPENGETLYICTKCRFQFIIKVSYL